MSSGPVRGVRPERRAGPRPAPAVGGIGNAPHVAALFQVPHEFAHRLGGIPARRASVVGRVPSQSMSRNTFRQWAGRRSSYPASTTRRAPAGREAREWTLPP